MEKKEGERLEREQKRDGQTIKMFTKERETGKETEKKDLERKEIHR